MAGKGGGNNESGGDNTTWIAGAFVVGGILYGLWLLQRQLIVLPMFAMKWVQVKIYSLFMGLTERGASYLQFIEDYFNGNRDPKGIYWEEFVDVAQTVGSVMSIPVALAIALVGLYVYKNMKGDNFKRQLGLLDLKKYQAEHWRTLTTSAKFNPDKSTANMMPAQTPVEFLRELKLKARLTDKGSLPEDSHVTVTRAFENQLGPAWKPVPKLSLHVRCILAIAASHNAKKTAVSVKLRQDIDVAWNMPDEKKRDALLETLIAEILADEKAMAPLLEKAEKHAYVSTALISILKLVRVEKGVLASAEFLWIKEVDRTLWYVLNNVGRRAFHVECAGVWSHYFHENVMNRPIIEPKIAGAIDGVEKYLDEQGIDEPA